MKKGLLMLLAGFMVLGASVKVYADARIDGMSTDVREVEDLDLIWLYPNKVVDFKNTVDFRLNYDSYQFGGGTQEWGGVIADETASLGGVLGMYVNRPTDQHTRAYNVSGNLPAMLDPFRYYSTPVGNTTAYAQNNDFDLFYGTGIGGGNLGVHVNYTDNGIQTAGVDEEDQVALSLGLGLNSVGPFSQLNIHADYGMDSVTKIGATTKNKDNGINTIKLGALGQADLSDTSYIRTFLDLASDQDNLTDLVNTNWSDMSAVLGASLDHKVNGGKGLVASGLVIDWIGGKENVGGQTFDSWVLFWNGSVESQVADWLTIRAGLEKALVDRQYNSAGTPTYYGITPAGSIGQNVDFSTGLSINWQNFTLNGRVTAASLENSINNVAPGNGLLFTNGQPIVMIHEADITYKF